MRDVVALVTALALSAGALSAQPGATTPGTLDIYVVDVEGGNATLFVSPAGQSLLIDSGNAGAGAVRDAERIVAAAKAAGLTQIDHLITTHWHGDHFGGMAELAARMPIRHFLDHGPNTQPAPGPDEFLATTYPRLYAGARHTVVAPGATIAIPGLNVTIVTAGGKTITAPLAGAGAANPYCRNFSAGAVNTEDPMSVGTSVVFGRFRALHLGDLTRRKEFELMCPANRIGAVDVLLGLHHGVDSSNSEVLVHAARPRVAIMNNGTRKGGAPDVMKTLHTSPGLEDVWQMHFSELSGQEYTAPGLFVANFTDEPFAAMPLAPMPAPQPGAAAPPAPVHNGTAYWIKVSARADGSFTVTNGRNGFSKTYAARRRPGA
jgi:beta-lactamase superfamily II metal-dependent hydrolase